MKNDDFLVFLANWILFPKILGWFRGDLYVTCSCMLNRFYFVLWPKLTGKSVQNYER